MAGTLYNLTLDLLTKHPQLRDSDKKLIWSVWYTLGYNTGETMTKEQFMKDTCPPAESIRRCRQKIQETHPELDASPSVKKLRDTKEKDKGTFIYREEAKKEGVGHWEFEGNIARFIPD